MAIMIFVTILLLLMIGLAIDGGRTFHTQHEVQKAADAGVLAAVTYVNHIGITAAQSEAASTGRTLKDLLLLRAAEAARANLAQAGFPPMTRGGVQYPIVSPASTNPADFVPNGQRLFDLQVSVQYPISYLIMQYIPLEMFHLQRTSTGITLSATAGAIRKIANVCVMLDFSSSMQCPATGTPGSSTYCECLTQNRTGPCQRPQKIDELVSSVKEFLRMFDFNNDRIGIVTFNVAAQSFTLGELAALAQSHIPPNMTLADLDGAIDNVSTRYQPAGDTNIADALMAGQKLMKSISPGQEVAYVMFSDGAPSAGRFLFASPKGGLAGWDASDPANPDGLYDYSLHGVSWASGGQVIQGPSVLYQNGLVPMGWTGAEPPPPFAGNAATWLPGDPMPGATIAACGPQLNPPITTQADYPNAIEEVFDSCLQDLGAKVPTATPGIYDTVGKGNLPDDPGFADFQKMYYLYSIALADYMRSIQGTFYVIGLGEPCAVGGDPFQDFHDSHCRKDIFFRRLANDFKGAVLNPTQYDQPPRPADPEMNFTGYQNYDAWQRKSAPRMGEYYPRPDTQGLQSVFRKIAVKIGLGLVF